MNLSRTRDLLHTRNKAKDEWIVSGLVISAFFSIYLLCAAAVVFCAYLCISKRIVAIVRQVPHSYLLLGFGGCGLGITLICSEQLLPICIACAAICAIIIILYLRTVMTNELFDDAMDWACTASLFSVGVAIIQMVIMRQMNPVYRSASVFTNANYFAAMMEMVVMISLYRMMQPKKAFEDSFYMICIVSAVVGIFLSGCRTALVVIVLSIPVLLFLTHRPRLFFLYCSLGAIGLALILTGIIDLPRFDTLFNDLSIRQSIWHASAMGIMDKPLLGHGWMGYLLVYGPFHGSYTTHAHNLFLEFLLNFGIVGTFLFLGYFISNLRRIWKSFREGYNVRRIALTITLLFAALVHGMVDVTCTWPQTALLLGIALACPIQRPSPPCNSK